MDAPVEAVTDPVAELPDADQSASFEASLEAAFAKLESATADEPAETPAKPTEPTESTEPTTPVEDATDEPLDSLTDDIGDEWTPKAANRFKQLKAELKTNRSELEQLRQAKTEYEAKIQELTGLADSKDVEQLQTKLAEYEKQQMFSNLEATSAYQQAVTEPLAALMEQADQIADKYEVDADALVDILALDDPAAQEEQLAELLPNASDRDKARIFRIMEEIDPILQRRQQLYANADAALAEAKQLEEQRVAAEAAQKLQLRQNVTRNVVERVQQKLPFLNGIEGLDISAIQQKAAESDPSVIHPVDYAYNAVSAQLLPTIVRQYMAAMKEVDALTDRLAEYEEAEPTVSGQAKSSVGSNGISDGMTFEQRVNAALGSM